MSIATEDDNEDHCRISESAMVGGDNYSQWSDRLARESGLGTEEQRTTIQGINSSVYRSIAALALSASDWLDTAIVQHSNSPAIPNHRRYPNAASSDCRHQMGAEGLFPLLVLHCQSLGTLPEHALEVDWVRDGYELVCRDWSMEGSCAALGKE